MRILIYRLGSLGDTVLALPCFHLIREAYPEARITVLTNAPVSGKAAPLEAILGTSGLVDEVIHYPIGLRDPAELFRLCRRLRGGKFDLVISLTAARGLVASLRDTLFFRAAGIPKIMGVPFAYRDLICEMRADGSGLFESEAMRLLRRTTSLGQADLDDRKWLDLQLTATERSEADRLLAQSGVSGTFVAASVGTKSPLNDWGSANWIKLLGDLSLRWPEVGIILLGSTDEAARSEELLVNWKGPRANLCGMTTPRVSAALLERAVLFIGHDSGPMHLAAAAGTRCVAIFSARCPPGQWFPVGSGHAPIYPRDFYDPGLIEDSEHQQKALASISVDTVLRATEIFLADLHDGVSAQFKSG